MLIFFYTIVILDKCHWMLYLLTLSGDILCVARAAHGRPRSPILAAHSPSVSNSMDIVWPAVDSYRTSYCSFYIYYFYFTCRLSGRRVVTYVSLYIRQQVASLDFTLI